MAYGASLSIGLLSRVLNRVSESTRQISPDSTAAGQADSAPPPPPMGPHQGGLGNRMLRDLLQVQEARPTSTNLASRMISRADADGDGALGSEEVRTAIGAPSGEGFNAAFARLDTDGDAKLSAAELSTALEARRSRRPHGPTTLEDASARMIGAVDTNGDGQMSLAEIQARFSLDGSDALTRRFGSLDADGDGQVTAAEVAAGLQTLMGYGGGREQQTSATTTTVA